jgi:glycosyltransferase involved in cell wall biosynthesis
VRVGLDLSKLGGADGLGTFTGEAFAALAELAGEEIELIGYDLMNEAKGWLPGVGRGGSPDRDRLDAFVAASFVAPRLAPATRLLFVVYDLTFLSAPDCHTVWNRLHCLDGLIGALAADGELLAISRAGAAELGELLGRPAADFPVLPLAPAPDFRPLAADETARTLAPLGLEPGGYLLSVGSLEPRKNVGALLAAHAVLPEAMRRAFPLVLAGSPGWKNETLSAELNQAQEAGFARRLGRVPRETLVALFSGAALFAYPSLAEGYGLPVVEAMACGAPVLTSSLSALPETAGGAARLADPRDPAALEAALAELLGSPAERERLRGLGLARVAGLSWHATAAALLSLLTSRKPS